MADSFTTAPVKLPDEKADPGLDTEFKRGLGLFSATMVVVGSMIGSGIFLVSADMGRLIGSPGFLLVAWLKRTKKHQREQATEPQPATTGASKKEEVLP